MNELLKLKRVGENNIGTLKKRHKRSHEPMYKTNEKLSKEIKSSNYYHKVEKVITIWESIDKI